MTAVDLSYVIVNWNTVGLLDDCLQSIVDHGPTGLSTEIVVVDNASTDGSVEHLAARWPSVRVIANEDNVGFCRANNQAIRQGTAPNILLVNTDARLTEGCVDRMLATFDRDPQAGVVGPRLVYGDGTFQRWTAGAPLSLRSCATFLLGLDRLPRRPGPPGMYLDRDTHVPFRPGWVTSAVMLLRRRALDEVGLLDEAIFVYMDDVDLCQRMVDHGWTVWYAADTTAVHFMGGSTKLVTGNASPEALRAMNRWFEHRHGIRAAYALRALETLGFGGRAAVCGLRSVLTGDDDARGRGRDHWSRVKVSLEVQRV